MDAKTRKALEGSIKKWQMIVDGTGEDHGSKNCPLCAMFLGTGSCRGCPIFEKTKLSLCWNTPYVKYTIGDNKAAQAELDFLISLRPVES
jgi:hypothetical protein